MKKTLLVILVNFVVLAVLLVVLEVFLRLAGMESIVGKEKKAQRWKTRYQEVCRKIKTEKLVVYDSFSTDGEGLFKANPEYFRQAQEKISINQDGFRGHPFEFVDTSRRKVFLIGDSFVWGNGAEPLSECFADLLEEAGYHIYNGGIPGTDPQQYAMVAEKYAPVLKPDLVAVCVYMGNDVSPRPLLMMPGKNLHYVSNFGFFLGYDDKGRFFKDGREAFQYLKKRKCGHCTDIWDRLVFKTVIGKGIYGVFHRNRFPRADGTKRWVRESLIRIRDTCQKHGSEFILLLIPSVNQDVRKNITIDNNLDLFQDLPCYYPNNLEKSDYREPPDNHFNNQGHIKYANFIIEVFKQHGFEAEKGR
jgi:hypothetical protein